MIKSRSFEGRGVARIREIHTEKFLRNVWKRNFGLHSLMQQGGPGIRKDATNFKLHTV